MMNARKSSTNLEGGEYVPDDLQEVKEKLAAIESLLQRLPEIQAAVFLKMLDEYQSAKLIGKTASDLWEVPSPPAR